MPALASKALLLAFERLPVPVLVWDASGNIRYANSGAERILGYDAGELVGKPADTVVDDATGLAHRHPTPRTGEAIARHAQGFPVPVEIAVNTFQEAGYLPHVLAVLTDISARRQLEQRVREREAALRRGQHLARLSHVITGPKGGFESWSETFEELVGLEAGRLPPSTRAWLQHVHPGDREAFRAAAISAAKTGQRTQVAYRVRRSDGSYMSVQQVMEPLESHPGAPRYSRWFSTLQDITELKRAEDEVRRANAELEVRVAERTRELESINRELEAFSYSVSHDLRAPLRRILGFSEALAEGAGGLDGEGRALVERIAAVATHMDRLVTGLLGLSMAGRGEIARQRVDLARLAHSSFEALRRAEPQRDVSLTVHGPLIACADVGLVQAVLDNLIGNAWKFTSRRDGAVIEVGARAGKGACEYFVRDNGAGFDPRNAAKLFRPFQRLHSAREFEGTGIGLATVRRIVARHGGEVGAEGSIGGGCTVWFTLPSE